MAIDGLKDYMLTCVNKKIFGVECPGCGTQRSIALLLKGDFIGAFKMYPAIYPMLLLLIFLVFNLFVKFKHDNKVKLGLIFLTVGVIIISYIIKMSSVM